MTSREHKLLGALDAIIAFAEERRADQTSYPWGGDYHTGCESGSGHCAEIAKQAIKDARETPSAVEAVIEARQRFSVVDIDDDYEYHHRCAALVVACENLEREVMGRVASACGTCEGKGHYSGIGERQIECHVCKGEKVC